MMTVGAAVHRHSFTVSLWREESSMKALSVFSLQALGLLLPWLPGFFSWPELLASPDFWVASICGHGGCLNHSDAPQLAMRSWAQTVDVLSWKSFCQRLRYHMCVALGVVGGGINASLAAFWCPPLRPLMGDLAAPENTSATSE